MRSPAGSTSEIGAFSSVNKSRASFMNKANDQMLRGFAAHDCYVGQATTIQGKMNVR